MTPNTPEAVPIAIVAIMALSMLSSYLITFYIIAPYLARKQDELRKKEN